MKTNIVDNDYYSLCVDIDINRAYLTVKGYWPSVSAVPNFITDFKTAISYLVPEFTLLVDARTMKVHPKEVSELHQEMQVMLKKAGLLQTAEVLNSNDAVALQLKRIQINSSMPLFQLNDINKAESYLDRISMEAHGYI